jgi:hypothetical protein
MILRRRSEKFPDSLLYRRRQILHHFSWASIRKVWVYMLSTGYDAKNDAKLTAVCIRAANSLILRPTSER